ncbi:hypothetical protein BTVI_36879 [Pitangus sulphuratus]|nr:hypothetical protein BTVI_36879 [Pitangus sulphuratus]
MMETWWDSSHDWNVVMMGYMLFRTDRPRRHSEGFALCVRQHLECIELCLEVDDKPPDQEEELDEAFYRELETASKSQELVLVGDFNYPDICWRSKQSKRFLESTDVNFLPQVVEVPTRNGVLLNLIVRNREEPVGCSLGCSDHGTVDFRIRQEGRREAHKIVTMDFRRANFSLFSDLPRRILWEQALQRRGVQEREADI